MISPQPNPLEMQDLSLSQLRTFCQSYLLRKDKDIAMVDLLRWNYQQKKIYLRNIVETLGSGRFFLFQDLDKVEFRIGGRTPSDFQTIISIAAVDLIDLLRLINKEKTLGRFSNSRSCCDVKSDNFQEKMTACIQTLTQLRNSEGLDKRHVDDFAQSYLNTLFEAINYNRQSELDPLFKEVAESIGYEYHERCSLLSVLNRDIGCGHETIFPGLYDSIAYRSFPEGAKKFLYRLRAPKIKVQQKLPPGWEVLRNVY